MLNYENSFAEYCSGGDLYENIINAFYTMLVKKNDVVIDCGAHKGYHTFPLAELVGPLGRVHAFEALPELAKQLTIESLEKYPNIKVHPVAVSDFVGTTKFHHVINNLGLSGIKKRSYYSDSIVEVIEVPVTSLDVLLPDANPTFIKLDLEGGEFAVLRGAENILKRAKPMLIFEHAGNNTANYEGYALMDFYNFLKNHGYQIYNILGQRREEEKFADAIPWYFVAVAQTEHIKIIENAPLAIISAALKLNRDNGRSF